MEQADAIIVGAGLAGLAAAAELGDRGKRVIVVDQEPRSGLGARRSGRLAGFSWSTPPNSAGWASATAANWPCPTGWAARSLTGPRMHGRANGPRPISTLPQARCARGCTRWACAGFRWWAGPNGAAALPTGMAIRCRGFTSPGAPAPARWNILPAAVSNMRARGWSRSSSATALTALT